MIARNCARAVAELHEIGIVHGDIASENLMVHSESQEVKLIDFDLARKEGTLMNASGNPDFINTVMQKAINQKKQIKVSYLNDFYSLALLCYLLLGDKKRIFIDSLSGDAL